MVKKSTKLKNDNTNAAIGADSHMDQRMNIVASGSRLGRYAGGSLAQMPESDVYLPLPHETRARAGAEAEAEAEDGAEVLTLDDHQAKDRDVVTMDVVPTKSRDRLAELKELDENADSVLVANKDYQNTILATMQKIAHAAARTEELESFLKDYSEILSTGPQLIVEAPETQLVSLPWFKHYHGSDLPGHRDAQARELYLRAIRPMAWMASEKLALKREIIRFNNGLIAAEAEELREDITEKLAGFHPSYFIEAVDDLDWEKIALVIPKRKAVECRIQWLQNDHPSINHAKWKKDELSELYRIADEHGCRDWVKISQELGTQRTACDCLRQYRARSGLRQHWTEEEDAELVLAVKKFGENWQSVARQCGKSANQCLNRWGKSLHPTLVRNKWTAEEDALLVAAFAICGNFWKLVAQRVPQRNDAQCRERYCNILDPNILDPRVWSPEDEEKLYSLREEGGKSWSEIATAFENKRTDNHCMRKFAELQKRKAREEEERLAATSPGGTYTEPDPFVPRGTPKKRPRTDEAGGGGRKKRKKIGTDEAGGGGGKKRKQAGNDEAGVGGGTERPRIDEAGGGGKKRKKVQKPKVIIRIREALSPASEAIRMEQEIVQKAKEKEERLANQILNGEGEVEDGVENVEEGGHEKEVGKKTKRVYKPRARQATASTAGEKTSSKEVTKETKKRVRKPTKKALERWLEDDDDDDMIDIDSDAEPIVRQPVHEEFAHLPPSLSMLLNPASTSNRNGYRHQTQEEEDDDDERREPVASGSGTRLLNTSTNLSPSRLSSLPPSAQLSRSVPVIPLTPLAPASSSLSIPAPSLPAIPPSAVQTRWAFVEAPRPVFIPPLVIVGKKISRTSSNKPKNKKSSIEALLNGNGRIDAVSATPEPEPEPELRRTPAVSIEAQIAAEGAEAEVHGGEREGRRGIQSRKDTPRSRGEAGRFTAQHESHLSQVAAIGVDQESEAEGGENEDVIKEEEERLGPTRRGTRSKTMAMELDGVVQNEHMMRGRRARCSV